MVSGTGSNLAALLAAHDDPAYGARVVAVVADRRGIRALDIAAEAGIPTAVVSVKDFDDRAAWDAAIAETVAVFRPDLVVLAGLHEAVRRHVPRAVRRPDRQHAPGAAAGLPRGARRPGRARVRRQGDRLHGDGGRRGHRHGPDPGPGGRRGASPTTTRRRCTSGSRSSSGRCSWTGWGGSRAAVSRSRGGTPPSADRDSATVVTGAGGFNHREAAAVPRHAPPAWVHGSAVPTHPSGSCCDLTVRPVRRALVSVYDKTGLTELAGALHAAGVEIVSTGSTAATIAATGVPVTRVEDLTGFPECLDGRVKTLHPRVHAGVLADTRLPEHLRQLDELGIAPFELVVVNLYPFTATVASGASPDECVEQIDIGGPSMVRAAAKNHPSVAVVVDPAPLRRGRRGRERRAASRSRRAACSPPTRSRTRPRTTRPSRPGSPAPTRPTTRAASRSSPASTLRARRGAALRREPAPAAPRST